MSTGTPMQLGSSPALPNISFEITGFVAGTAGPAFPNDARPDGIVTDLLTNPRYGAGFPAANLDTAGRSPIGATTARRRELAMSLLLDRQQPCARWLEEIAAADRVGGGVVGQYAAEDHSLRRPGAVRQRRELDART